MKKLQYPKPSNSLLARALPLEIWQLAERQAKRGNTGHFCVGAVLFSGNTILSRACSYVGERQNTHAESSALANVPRHLTDGADVAIVSVYCPTGGWSFSSRPCGRCARHLHARGIRFAHYAYRDADGVWSVRTEDVAELAEIATREYDNFDNYASRLKIRGVTPVRIVAA